jgi:hypothetical protein
MKRALAIVTVAIGTFMVLGGTASATVDSVAPPPPVDVPAEVSTVAIAAPIVTLIVSVVIPLITALLTRGTTPSWVKAIVMIVLNGVSAFVTSTILPDGSVWFTSVTFWTWLIGIGISTVSYVVAYKPNAITSNAGGKLENVGVSN